MSELEDKIAALLSSPDGMEQVLSVAKSLMGNSDDTPMSKDQAQSTDAAAAADNTDNTGGSDLSALAGLGNLDPAMINTLVHMLGEYNSGDDQKTSLLKALKPYVRKEKHEKIDKAVQIAKLARVAKSALSSFNGGSKDV